VCSSTLKVRRFIIFQCSDKVIFLFDAPGIALPDQLGYIPKFDTGFYVRDEFQKYIEEKDVSRKSGFNLDGCLQIL